MPKPGYRAYALVLLAGAAGRAAAAAPAATTVATGPTLPAGSILQVVAGLAAVLAMVWAIAWLLKRFSPVHGSRSGLVRVIGGAALGQRERIVVVEVGGTWLLLGVAPGQVRTLHTMPRTEPAVAPGAPAPQAAGFATWLRRVRDKRNHD